MKRFGVDDPVGSIGVHWACGVLGMVVTGFFADTSDLAPDSGIFRGGSGKLLGVNIAMIIAVTIWSGGLVALLVSSFEADL